MTKEEKEIQEKAEQSEETPEVKEEVVVKTAEKEKLDPADELDKKKKRQEEEEEEPWIPKTNLGHKVFNGEITDIDEIIDAGGVILEPQIVDKLLALESDLILIGQSKGKFGGGQRRIFKQTQKKTREGNKPQFTTLAVVGDKNGHIGFGMGKAKETVPAREKAMKKAKKNIFKIRRGCGSWECGCEGSHSIPFKVRGKCGSVEVVLMPAPKGKGLVCEGEVAKVLTLAGIEDVWSKSFGHTENKINLMKALEKAMRRLVSTKLNASSIQAKIFEGAIYDSPSE